MNVVTERLIAFQDLLQLRRDLHDQTYGELGFVTAGEAAVDAEIENLRGEIDKPLLKRFETIAGKYERPLVPIRNGVCYGCFVRFPTARLTELDGSEPTTCNNCGRLLYKIQ